MIQIPLKVSKPCDLGSKLNVYIKSKYKSSGKEEEQAISDSLAKLNQMRINAVSVTSSGAASESTLLTYYNQLSLVGARFPISESNVSQMFVVCVPFPLCKNNSFNTFYLLM